MKRLSRAWIAVALTVSLIVGLLPVGIAAAAAKITITNLYVTNVSSDIASGRPVNDNLISRVTTNQTNVNATIESVTDAQLPSLYVEVTNVTTAQRAEVRTIRAQKTGANTIVFNNVPLTEGLNRVVIRLDGSPIQESAPGWVYYTASTSISDVKVNGATFDELKLVPANPEQSTAVTITGLAPNATEAQLHLFGAAAPVVGSLVNNVFTFTGDDIHKPNNTANVKLKPGDNQMTIMALNASKSYQVERNLIYDNAKPFAFNAIINDGTSSGKRLVRNPVVNNTAVSVNALLKVDLDAQGNPKYRYVDIMAGGKLFGPYDLGGAESAVRVTDIYPKLIYQGHSDLQLTMVGTLLQGVRLFIESNDGTITSELSAVGTASDGTVRWFNLNRDVASQALLAAKSPYKLIARNAAGATLSTHSVTVAATGNVTLPVVTDGTLITTEQEGNTATDDQTINFTAPLTSASPAFSVQITNVTGSTVIATAANMTGYANGSSAVTFKLPSFLTAGQYKFRVVYSGYALTERHFTVDPRPPGPPAITKVTSAEVYYTAANGTKTHLFVEGSRFGTDRALVSAELDNGTEQLPLTLVDLTDTSAVFLLPNQEAADHNSAYDLDMTISGVTVSSADAVTGQQLTVGTDTDGKKVTDASPLQFRTTELTLPTTQVKIVGAALNNPTGTLAARVLREDGTDVGAAAISGVQPTEALIKPPATLAAGHYILRITNNAYGTTAILGQYPLTIVNPVPTSLSPHVRPVTAPDNTANQALTLLGTSLGRELSPLKLRFTSNANGAVVDEKTAEVIAGGTSAKFDAPVGLPEGSYKVEALYNNVVLSPALTYTVSTPLTTLRENTVWSKDGDYKVYDFAANLNLSTNRAQTIDFMFYNSSTDTVPPTSYAFRYENPALPYIDRVELNNQGRSYPISDATITDLKEIPSRLVVYTSANTNSVNYYLGPYGSGSVPIKAIPDGTEGGFKKFVITLQDAANGLLDVTMIPSITTLGANDPPTKVGEHLDALRTYRFNVSGSPYIIANNMYNGMIIRDLSDLRCMTPFNQTLASCIDGRLVNIPVTQFDKVDVYVNNHKFTMSNTFPIDDFLDDSGRFSFQFGPGTNRPLPASANGNLLEGKNTFRFVYQQVVNGMNATVFESTIEMYRSSTNVPSLNEVRPRDTVNNPRFKLTTTPDTYTTNETSVSFTGQFINTSDLTLTVKTVDPTTNQPSTSYERRYGFGLSQLDPTLNNPAFFTAVHQPMPGQFATRSIPLPRSGEAVFEFRAANDYSSAVVKRIVIKREVIPYTIMHPKMTRNDKGIDQANINSNFVEFDIRAENATAVLFDDIPASAREVVDPVSGAREVRYFYEVRNLRSGVNNVEFTVVRGAQQVTAKVVVFHANLQMEGAQFKSPIRNKISAFDNAVQLSFPKDTKLYRNDPAALNQYITADRQLLFGIASSYDGRIDKVKHPAAYDNQTDNLNPLIPDNARLMLVEPTGRFRPISALYWIDAGTIPAAATDLQEALTGSGQLPYDAPVFYNRNVQDLVVPSQSGSLTLKYDPTVRGEAWKYVAVYHYDIYEDHAGITGPRWRNVGGAVNPNNNTITVPLERFGYYQVMYMMQSFPDIVRHPWAKEDLEILYARNIMRNKKPSTFLPNDPISRGEFATLLVKIFEVPVFQAAIPTFLDVPRIGDPMMNGLYEYKYIETAAKTGIVRGYGSGLFQPEASITRQDAAVMIARAANMKLVSNEAKVLPQLQKSFTDADTINIYARTAVQAVSAKGFIVGKENAAPAASSSRAKPTYRFDPDATFTRAEAAAVTVRVMRDQNKIPK